MYAWLLSKLESEVANGYDIGCSLYILFYLLADLVICMHVYSPA